MSDSLEYLPALRGRLPWTPLAAVPTPVERLERLSEALGVELWVKRDDRTSDVFGGNKVRKLEFLLAEAGMQGAKRILTFGGVGSNHVIACAAHGAQLGLGVEAIVVDQPLTDHVRHNLLLGRHFGVHYHRVGSPFRAAGLLVKLRLQIAREDGIPPLVIPPGGSNAPGSIGYALAARELDAQIRAGECPAPDTVFVAAGSGGTLAGLMVGAAGLSWESTFIGVGVYEKLWTNEMNLRRIALSTQGLLRLKLPGIGREIGARLPPHELNFEFFGGRYGRPTKAAEAAIERVRAEEGLPLEPVYTGKTFAAVLEWAKRKENRGRRVLYWHTCNSADLSHFVAAADWQQLPVELHSYFDGTRERARPV